MRRKLGCFMSLGGLRLSPPAASSRDEKRTDAENLSGTGIEGGSSQAVAKGDVIIVPGKHAALVQRHQRHHRLDVVARATGAASAGTHSVASRVCSPAPVPGCCSRRSSLFITRICGPWIRPTRWRALWSRSPSFSDHTVTLDRFVPWLRQHVLYTRAVIVDRSHGHFYSQYPIGGPVFASPLYLPLALVGNLRDWDPGSLVMFARVGEDSRPPSSPRSRPPSFCYSCSRALPPTPWAWCLTLLYALGTETWSISSQALWQHGPGELAIIGALAGPRLLVEASNIGRGLLWICGASAACGSRHLSPDQHSDASRASGSAAGWPRLGPAARSLLVLPLRTVAR